MQQGSISHWKLYFTALKFVPQHFLWIWGFPESMTSVHDRKKSKVHWVRRNCRRVFKASISYCTASSRVTIPNYCSDSFIYPLLEVGLWCIRENLLDSPQYTSAEPGEEHWEHLDRVFWLFTFKTVNLRLQGPHESSQWNMSKVHSWEDSVLFCEFLNVGQWNRNSKTALNTEPHWRLTASASMLHSLWLYHGEALRHN